MIIDFHTHCYPNDIAVRAIENVTKTGRIKAANDGTLHALRQSMDESGIQASLNLPLALSPENEKGVNSWAAKINCIAKQTGIYSLGSIHPECFDVKNRLKWLQDLGLKGIKLHPEYQYFSPHEERMFPIYETCQELGLFILFHAGDDLAFNGKPRSRPEDFVIVNDQFSELKIILAHLGGIEYTHEPSLLLANRKNVWFDVAYLSGIVPNEIIEKTIRLFGTDKVLYGTDSPFRNQLDHLTAFKKLNFSEDEFQTMFYKNALKFLS